MHYQQEEGVFLHSTPLMKANVASTWAMFSTREAWLAADIVPQSIPHYLSDYWLTYNLIRKGFELVQPPGFVCYASMASTRNNPHDNNKYNSLSGYLNNIISACDIKSPCYAPAWIEFLSQHPISTSVRKKIWKLRFKYFIARFIYAGLSMFLRLRF